MFIFMDKLCVLLDLQSDSAHKVTTDISLEFLLGHRGKDIQEVVPIFDMCNFYSKLIDLDPKTHFHNFTSSWHFIFSPGAKQVCDTGDKAVMKIHKKMNIGYQNRYIFCYNFQRIVNLKLIFWGYNKKNMSFHLTPKNKLLLVAPWG